MTILQATTARASRRAVSIVAALSLGLGANVASADPATGTRIKDRPATGSMVWSQAFNTDLAVTGKNGEANRRMRKVAGCLVTKHKREAAAYIALSPEALSSSRMKRSFDDKVVDCLSYYMGTYSSLQVELPTLLMRGFIAEAFLHQWPRPSLAPLPTVRKSYSASWMSANGAPRVVEEMSACMAEIHPEQAISVLATPMGSAEQNEAVRAVIAVLPDCLQQGAKLETDVSGLRAALALGIYHRIVDTPASAAAKVD